MSSHHSHLSYFNFLFFKISLADFFRDELFTNEEPRKSILKRDSASFEEATFRVSLMYLLILTVCQFIEVLQEYVVI